MCSRGWILTSRDVDLDEAHLAESELAGSDRCRASAAGASSVRARGDRDRHTHDTAWRASNAIEPAAEQPADGPVARTTGWADTPAKSGCVDCGACVGMASRTAG